MIRIGCGYDVHRFSKDRDLILGGVKIDFRMGLLGHSDADVLIHAVCDALLGAAGLGDIGKHFPDSDDRYKNIDSKIILRKTGDLLKEKGFSVINVDSTVIAQKPKISEFTPLMEENIASCLGIDCSFVNVKATTEEGLGFTGSLEGVSANAVALITDE